MSNARNLSKLTVLAQYLSALLQVGQQGPLPTGTALDFTGKTLPSGYIWADGTVLAANTPHTALRALYIADGFPHGQDGSGNPKVPDARGRTSAAPDNMGGTAAGRLTNASTVGAVLGTETHVLTTAQLPAHDHTYTDRYTASSSYANALNGNTGGSAAMYNPSFPDLNRTTADTGSGQAHPNVQPTIVLNKIIKT